MCAARTSLPGVSTRALFAVTSSTCHAAFSLKHPPRPLPTSPVTWLVLTFTSLPRHLLQKTCLLAPGPTQDAACVPVSEAPCTPRGRCTPRSHAHHGHVAVTQFGAEGLAARMTRGRTERAGLVPFEKASGRGAAGGKRGGLLGGGWACSLSWGPGSPTLAGLRVREQLVHLNRKPCSMGEAGGAGGEVKRA